MMNISAKNIERLMNIGILLSSEQNIFTLLDTILTEAMEITNCDAGTLYLHENNELHFKVMRNHTMNVYQGGRDTPITLPPVAMSEQNVCAYVAIHRGMENIEDVYFSDKFDFCGPKNYDKMTGYHTKSMLVIPLENNKSEVVGVLQLLNALDEQNQVIAFDKEFEQIFRSVASQAAIAVTNMQYIRENRELLHSLVQVLAAAIDERSPYNANHTKNVALIVTDMLEYIESAHANGETDISFTEGEKQEIILAAWLHDVGKIITPLEIMDKATRLGSHLEIVELRFKAICLAEENRFLKGLTPSEEWAAIKQDLVIARELCKKANSGAPTSPEEIELIGSYGKRATIIDDVEVSWLDEHEIENLGIRYGTLSAGERKIMENHVVITARLLEKISFSNEYKHVATIAGSHHERLNGKGYPHGLTAEDLPLSTRIISVVDVFEALTAKDRPYKKAMPLEKVFHILDEMVDGGDLDSQLVKLLKSQQRWGG